MREILNELILKKKEGTFNMIDIDSVHHFFIYACKELDIDTVQLVYQHFHELPNFNISVHDDLAFSVCFEDPELCDLFIYEYKLELSDRVKSILTEKDSILDKFDKRSLYNTLYENLPSKESSQHLSKI